METKELQEVFISYGIQDVLPQIQTYVDFYELLKNAEKFNFVLKQLVMTTHCIKINVDDADYTEYCSFISNHKERVGCYPQGQCIRYARCYYDWYVDDDPHGRSDFPDGPDYYAYTHNSCYTGGTIEHIYDCDRLYVINKCRKKAREWNKRRKYRSCVIM